LPRDAKLMEDQSREGVLARPVSELELRPEGENRHARRRDKALSRRARA
jgi:hypothetical protein